MRVILLRPPRYVWPFNSETSAFWQPLGLLALAAYVRRCQPDVTIEVWDCPARRMGWRTLRQRLGESRIDVLGVGEETVSAHEAVRAARMVRRLWPDCLIVAGGVFFSHVVEPALTQTPIDVVVRGEGEQTFAELLRRAEEPDRWGSIPGLAFRDAGGQIVTTPPRELLADLDDLPLPAYDLVEMDLYGRRSRNHPGLVSIEHSRGCIDSCGFCILWRQMGRAAADGTVRPAWRTKSGPRSFEEVRRLYRQFGRRTFGWVDPTFNARPEWSDAWAERMLASDLVGPRGRARTVHTAWLRADGVVRDEKLGVLAKLVRAGLRQVMIGVERDDPAALAALGKHDNGPDLCREALAIFRERYPEVFTIGTMIFGLPGDTMADLRRLAESQYSMGMDYCFLMPLTPNPGGGFPAPSGEVESLDGEALARYNFHTPVMPTDRLSPGQLQSLYWRIMLRPDWRRIRRAAREIFTGPDPRKRRVFRALWCRGTTIAIRSLASAVLRRRRPVLYSRRPSWYEG